jgi:hypothetical protein
MMESMVVVLPLAVCPKHWMVGDAAAAAVAAAAAAATAAASPTLQTLQVRFCP